ncbi:MAG: methionine--tRNA ligase [Thermodesulfobacteriota bacterium]|nr:methionine--tRNA ligase [Thermodesulfobacteriota bacterium]
MAKQKTVVTSALPYANGPIHLGHLIEYIQTDIYVRFLRLTGGDVIYCCADDTHGTPIEISSLKEGISPEELIKRYYNEHIEDFKDFHIKFDSYYSTNSPENKYFSDLIFTKLKENGDIIEKEVKLTYCEHCKRFLPDRYIKGICPRCKSENQYGDNCEKCNSTYNPIDLIKPCCVICMSPPTLKEVKHYFFALKRYEDKLYKWLTQNKRLQKEITNYVINWIKDGLRDWDITRDPPYFGFKIKGEVDKYYYVWLDAPIGYIASTKKYCQDTGDDFDSYWLQENGRIIHFIGKDIIYFHFLFWPAMLMGSGFNLPENIFVHGFLTINKEKMSKSRGTFITAREYLEKFDPNYLRFYYASNISRSISDIDFDLYDFRDKINSHLIGNFCNLAYRSLSFLKKNLEGKIGRISPYPYDEIIKAKITKIKDLYAQCEFRSVIKEIMEIGDIGNKFLQESEPWKVIKKDKEKAREILSYCIKLVFQLCILLRPIIPELCGKLERQLNFGNLIWSDLERSLTGHEIKEPHPLISRIEKVELIKEDPFSSLDLRVAEIIEARPHINADKLIVLKVNAGEGGVRQIVAGIRGYYSVKELEKKKIIILANLKSTKIRGVKSEGMLLAVNNQEDLGILSTKAVIGSRIEVAGIKYDGTSRIHAQQFQKINILAKEGKVYYKDKSLLADNEDIFVEKNIEGIVK